MHFEPDKPILLGSAMHNRMGWAQIGDGSERPIAFGASRSLSPAKNNYSQLEKEGLGFVFGVTTFQQYLCGMTFVLITDVHPLLGLFSEQRPITAQVSA